MIPCDNLFHVGMRSELHESSQECDMRRLQCGDWYCDNRCHTHAERAPYDLDMEGCLRLFDVIVNGESMHLAPISLQERKEVALYFLGMTAEELESGMNRKKSSASYFTGRQAS